MPWFKNPLKVAAWFSLILSLLKLLAFLLTDSLLVLAGFFDSVTDTISSYINHRIHKVSLEKADREHPFGHGGFEVVASLIQGMILFFLGASLLIESIRAFNRGAASTLSQESMVFAVVVFSVSALGGYLVQRYLNSHVRKFEDRNERSLALVADQAHYAGDAWVNIISAAGLIAVHLSGMKIVDVIGGCLSSLLLIWHAVPILHRCFRDITHTEAPLKLQQEIVDIVMTIDPRIKGIHQLRSREFGPYLFVDFHMKLIDDLSLKDAHRIEDRVAHSIRKQIPRADVIIHLDPESEPDQQAWSPAYELPSK